MWIPQNLINVKSTLVHYLSQCWPRSVSSFGITRSQWLNTLNKMVYLLTIAFSNVFYWMKIYPEFPIKISLKYVPKDPIDNTSRLVLIVVWHPTGDKPLSKPLMAQFIDPYESLGLNELTQKYEKKCQIYQKILDILQPLSISLWKICKMSPWPTTVESLYIGRECFTKVVKMVYFRILFVTSHVLMFYPS